MRDLVDAKSLPEKERMALLEGLVQASMKGRASYVAKLLARLEG
jgi:hypothetical protein